MPEDKTRLKGDGRPEGFYKHASACRSSARGCRVRAIICHARSDLYNYFGPSVVC